MVRKLKTVLLIDDDEAVNFINKRLITKNKLADNVVVAENSEEALKILFNHEVESNTNAEPDLIFLDLNMPGMDGWEFIEEYKHKVKKPGSKIVVLTTSINPADRKRALETPGISDYQEKPLTRESFSNLIEKHFSEISKSS